MPSEVICPTCGMSLLIESDDAPGRNGARAPEATVEVVLPRTSSFSSDSLDATSLPVGAADGPPPQEPPPAVARADPIAVVVDGPADSRGRSWPTILLGSYASAVTIACLWLLSGGRGNPPAPPAMIPADSRPELGHREDRSRRVEPASPIAPDRLTTLGRSIRVGALEVTPMEIRAGAAALERIPLDGPPEHRDGGPGSLLLKVRLRNLSTDQVFAPLDESFLREPDRGLPASFVESARGERIYPYPLAVESEWSIVGQSFRDLMPGEVRETLIASAPGAIDVAAGPSTWRLRLRSGPGRLDFVGVRFDADAIPRPRGPGG